MTINKINSLLSVKGVLLLSSTLLFALWIMMLSYTWFNIQNLISHHDVEDELNKITLAVHVILKNLDEALLTHGTIPSLTQMDKESKQIDSTLILLREQHHDNSFILNKLNTIAGEKIKLRKKLDSLNDVSHEISVNNPDVMMAAGSITATIESMLNNIDDLRKHTGKESHIAQEHIKTSITIVIIITVIITIVIFIFLYRGITRPFSALQDTAEKLQTEKLAAEKANRFKSAFLSRMSHELRTPLNAIIGFGQVMQLNKKDLNEDQQYQVDEILKAGQNLLSLINEILDLSKIERGKMEILLEKVNVNDLLHACISEVYNKAKDCQLKIINNIEGNNYTVRGNFGRLKQVLVHILLNAIKYNHNNGQIILDGELTTMQNLRISVTDSGEGLTEDEVASLFSPFIIINAVNNAEGAGIGLVICKNLVELMNGKIGVESTHGEGSTFWIEIPLEDELVGN